MSFTAQQQMREQQANISKQADNIRNQQMMLDASRRKRAAIRSGLVARATAITNASNQGAGSGSGVLGGSGAAVGNALDTMSDINSASILGNRMFANNERMFAATSNGQFWQGLGEGISSIGGAVLGNAGTITSLGQDWMKPSYGSAFTGGWGSSAWA